MERFLTTSEYLMHLQSTVINLTSKPTIGPQSPSQSPSTPIQLTNIITINIIIININKEIKIYFEQLQNTILCCR